jgi:hypothetical protein
MAGTGAGFSAMGGTLGAIGDIISAFGYKRPKLPQPGGQELRLRDIVQNQLIGGGLQYAAGQNLYNQLTPTLLSMLPGMTVTGGGSTGGAGGGGGTDGTGNLGMPSPATPAAGAAATPAMPNYQSALSNYQSTVGRNQQIQTLQEQLKAMKKRDPGRPAIQQQLKAAKQNRQGSVTAPQAERQVYQGAAASPSFNVGAPGSAPSDSGAGPFGSLSPSTQSTLAQIMGFLHGASGGTQPSGTSPLGPSGPFGGPASDQTPGTSPLGPLGPFGTGSTDTGGGVPNFSAAYQAGAAGAPTTPPLAPPIYSPPTNYPTG